MSGSHLIQCPATAARYGGSALLWLAAIVATLLCDTAHGQTSDGFLTDDIPSSPLRLIDFEQDVFANIDPQAFDPPTAGRTSAFNPLPTYHGQPEFGECCQEPWEHHALPSGLIYRAYLAGQKEPRFASVTSHMSSYGTIWDAALGSRVAIWRYGTAGDRPEGFEVELEGAVFPRLDPIADSTPLIASDYRIGIPVAYALGAWQFKLAYYHLSSHLGDEWILLNPGIRRLNYVRDEFVIGAGCYVTDDIRLYGEVGCAPSPSDGAEPWELQFGAEFSPRHKTDWRGAPFTAIHAHLRQENDFGGYMALQAGWQWRGESGHLLRLGVQYVTGKSDQGEFYDITEHRTGFGLWYDF